MSLKTLLTATSIICILFLKVRYVGDTLGKYNIKEVPFSTLKKDIPKEMEIYEFDYIVE